MEKYGEMFKNLSEELQCYNLYCYIITQVSSDSVNSKWLKWWPPGQYYGPRIGSGFNILSNREKSFKKSSYQNATICEITKQASSDSMDSKLLKGVVQSSR